MIRKIKIVPTIHRNKQKNKFELDVESDIVLIAMFAKHNNYTKHNNNYTKHNNYTNAITGSCNDMYSSKNIIIFFQIYI